MKDNFIELFQYEKWATGKVLGAMNQLKVQDEKCLEWMGHILAGQFVWYTRITNTHNKYELWGIKPLKECVKMYEEATQTWAGFCSTLSDTELEKTIHYKTFKGDPYENTLKDILTHVINHSTYHRGQIIAKLKGQLPALPSTDYIIFLREKLQ